MANHPDVQNYVETISQFNYAQLSNELQRLTNIKVNLIEFSHLLEQQYMDRTEPLANLLRILSDRLDLQEERRGHPDYLARSTSASFIREHQDHFRGVQLCQEIEEELEQLRVAYHYEVIYLGRHLTHLAFLSSIVGLASILRVERGDLL